MRSLLAACCILLPALLAAQQLDPAQDLRRQIAGQIDQVEADFASENLVCASRFDVNTCLAEARARRKARIKPLQARVQALDDELRQTRAQAQRDRSSVRKGELTVGDSRRSPMQAPVAAPRAPQLPRSAEQIWQEQHAKAAKEEQQALRSKEQLNLRQHQREEQQRAARQRGEQRQREGKSAAAPLPLPDPADIAAAASAAPGHR